MTPPLPIPDLNLAGVRTRQPEKPGTPRKLLRHLTGDDYILELDNSSFEAFQECDMRAFYKLILGRIAPPRYALTYGGIIHKFLEAFYLAKLEQRPFDLDAALVEHEALFLENPPDAMEWRTFDKFERTMRRYVAKYTNEDQFIVKSVEQAFAFPIAEFPIDAYLPCPRSLLVHEAKPEDDPTYEGSPAFYVRRIHVSWTGVIDLRIEENGQLWVVDHKTSSIEGNQFWDQFTLSQQLIGYTWAAQRITGEEYHGAMVNLIYGRPDTKTGKGKGETDPLMRRRFYYKRHLVDQWQSNTTMLLEDFIHDLTEARFPMKTQQCIGKYGACPFIEVCQLPEELRGQLLNSDRFHTNKWNPLDK